MYLEPSLEVEWQTMLNAQTHVYTHAQHTHTHTHHTHTHTVYRNNGKLDTNATASIILAQKNLMPEAAIVDGYMFPCVQGSPYSSANNITCDSASAQVDAAINYLESSKAAISRMWLDIEDEDPHKYFSASIDENQQILVALVAQIEKRVSN